jgi:hypothetical protein
MSDHAGITSTTFEPQHLVHGNAHLLLSEKATIASGQTLTAGAILGKSSNGKHYLASANDLAGSPISDGRANPVAILAHDIDASAADQEAMTYTRGDFIAGACYHDDSLDAATVTAALRDLSIQLIAAE